MDKMIIHGGAPLRGAVNVSGSKNATLPILMASLLTSEPVSIRNVPHLRDVETALALLRRLGVQCAGPAITTWCLQAESVTSHQAPYDLVKTMRASFFVLGPLLARAQTRQGFHSRWMRDRRAPGEPAHHRNSRARRAQFNCATATSKRMPTSFRARASGSIILRWARPRTS